MSNYRQIHMKIWKDSWFLDLEPNHKLLFIYLFSNERTSISGIYELSRRIMSFETGLSDNTITAGLAEFEKAGKAYCDGSIIWVKALRKFYDKGSEYVKVKMDTDIKEMPDCDILSTYCKCYGIPYPYPIHTLSEPLEDGIGTTSQYNVMYSNVIKSNVYNAHAENAPPMEVMSAIAAVVKETLGAGVNEDKFENAANVIIALDAVDKIPGFTPWWERNTYYKDNGKPSLKSFLNGYKDYLGGVEKMATSADTANVKHASGRL